MSSSSPPSSPSSLGRWEGPAEAAGGPASHAASSPRHTWATSTSCSRCVTRTPTQVAAGVSHAHPHRSQPVCHTHTHTQVAGGGADGPEGLLSRGSEAGRRMATQVGEQGEGKDREGQAGSGLAASKHSGTQCHACWTPRCAGHRRMIPLTCDRGSRPTTSGLLIARLLFSSSSWCFALLPQFCGQGMVKVPGAIRAKRAQSMPRSHPPLLLGGQHALLLAARRAARP